MMVVFNLSYRAPSQNIKTGHHAWAICAAFSTIMMVLLIHFRVRLCIQLGKTLINLGLFKEKSYSPIQAVLGSLDGCGDNKL
ncbi:hypothetical protein BDV26DRAFT_260899 [Aspergillus bertholletiae]|uniref:Uncharacterized protein n=1 Tax=Aspergillus bertholletiae TaxID=1226010 RepID=A0A5N7BAK1_9EURO|nr:hypothetical protein BDV26DRAFT_260899 [Aspergillus bertholletiae]